MIQNLTILNEMVTDKGSDLYALSNKSPVLLVFLRHFGCIFCREALKDLSLKRSELVQKGVHIVFVHMADNETADKYFKKYNLSGVDHISDPECKFYAAFSLAKGTFSQLFGLKNWIRAAEITTLGTPISITQIGDGFQMPGIFVLKSGRILESYIHKSAADRPDYDSIIACCEV